ncbi:MAG: hypothetical protein HF982_03270 [Desulfobacteraceae bacterium]|nr:hypothetical protein [Desulfobacteraceae bacterium]MBC2718605.1 hypothetical protein [Desulfobacteraceae bacterium]
MPALAFSSTISYANAESNSFIYDIAKEAKDGFNYLFKTLIFGTTMKPSDSTQNPNNDFLELPRYTFDFELRPDLFLNFRRVTLIAKPRINVERQYWNDGNRDGDSSTKDDCYVNEWIARLRLTEGLFASYGRENLQWGASFLLSPSNPFFRNNGQSNPKCEVPGMDFARFVWIPNSSCTASLIANTDEGRQEFVLDDFEPTYALKLDYNSYQKNFSVIASYKEEDRFQIGAFAKWTVSDALMLHGETSVTQGTNALYPVEIITPSGSSIQMIPVKKDETSLEGLLLLGGSYTLEAGPTLTLEYVFNSTGYDEKEAELYYELRDEASQAFYSPYSGVAEIAQLLLIQTLDTKLKLLRKNYFMLQYQHSQIRDVLNLIFRYTYNINDYSSHFVSIVEYDVGDHTQLFLIGNQNFGSKDTEFRSIVEYSWMFGLEYTF